MGMLMSITGQNISDQRWGEPLLEGLFLHVNIAKFSGLISFTWLSYCFVFRGGFIKIVCIKICIARYFYLLKWGKKFYLNISWNRMENYESIQAIVLCEVWLPKERFRPYL